MIPVPAEQLGDGFKVVFTGNISPAQSLETMIEAAEILKSEGLTDISWVIVGDGMSRGDVEKEVGRRGLREVFRFRRTPSCRRHPQVHDPGGCTGGLPGQE